MCWKGGAMSDSIHAATDSEQRLAAELRAIAIVAIQNCDLSTVQESLGLASSGLDRLLAESCWDLRLAFRVVDCLRVPVVDQLFGSLSSTGPAPQLH